MTSMVKYPKEEIMNDSIDESYFKVITELTYSPSLYNQVYKYTYKIKPIHGLEHMCYTCPSCKAEGLVSKKHSLVCTHCQNEYHYDKYGNLGGMSIESFVNASRKKLMEAYQENPLYQLSAFCQLQMFKDESIQIVGKGIITLDYQRYHYHGTIDGTMTDLYFDPKDISSLPSDIGINIQIYQDNQLHQFVFEDKYLPTKFVLFGEYLYLIKHE